MNKKDLPPSAVVLDLVLHWAEVIGADGTAKVMPDAAPFHERATLFMFVRNHRGEKLNLYTPVHFTGEPSDEQPTRWVLRRLGSSVWKLAPSILSDTIHAFITIVDVPEPAPWERQGSHEGGGA